MAVHEICDLMDCSGCAACAAICPRNAIEMRENKEGFAYPHIDEARCVSCGLCQQRCPVRNAPKDGSGAADFYSGWHLDKGILLQSSSGGAFTALAQWTFARGGTVFGVVRDRETDRLHYAEARDLETLAAQRTSKYYQSETRDVYPEVKRRLEAGSPVLFSGTACQVAGLYAYLLPKTYGNLITVDVLCHGVGSRHVVEAWKDSLEQHTQKKVADFSFRVKTGQLGWQKGNGTRMKAVLEDGTELVERSRYDLWFLGFNNNFFLRESCYRCKFCGTARVSDFTLADYWGCPETEFSAEQLWNGISVVMANSDRAKGMIDDLRAFMELRPADPQSVIARNRALTAPQQRPAIRDSFFEQMERIGYARTIRRAFKKRFIKREIKRILRWVGFRIDD